MQGKRSVRISLILLVTCLLSISASYSQEKSEREYKIKRSEVPLKAFEFIENTFQNKVKWYGEENLKGKSIEGKVRQDGHLFSVEFDTLGNLKDVEKLVRFNSLEENLQTNINEQLQAIFTKFKIRKTQIQWIGQDDDLKSLINEAVAKGPYTTNYEIIVRGTMDGVTSDYEFLFDKQGELVRESIIIFKNDHHLIF